MTTQPVEQRPDPAATDERHHEVDRIGRLDLRPQLAPQCWFTGRIGEQRRVEPRDERPGDRRWRPVGFAPEYGVKDRRWVRRHRLRIDPHEVAKTIEKRTCNL